MIPLSQVLLSPIVTVSPAAAVLTHHGLNHLELRKYLEDCLGNCSRSHSISDSWLSLSYHSLMLAMSVKEGALVSSVRNLGRLRNSWIYRHQLTGHASSASLSHSLTWQVDSLALEVVLSRSSLLLTTSSDAWCFSQFSRMRTHWKTLQGPPQLKNQFPLYSTDQHCFVYVPLRCHLLSLHLHLLPLHPTSNLSQEACLRFEDYQLSGTSSSLGIAASEIHLAKRGLDHDTSCFQRCLLSWLALVQSWLGTLWTVWDSQRYYHYDLLSLQLLTL